MIQYFAAQMFPHLKKDLRVAHIKEDPRAFIKKMALGSTYLSLALFAIVFFAFGRTTIPKYLLIAIFQFLYFVSFFFMMQYPQVVKRRRQKEIDREVLFAGRYLLVKIESGVPLFNALIDGSKSYGVMAKYFREIVEDIRTGVPIEIALENSREFSSSRQFRKILSELVTSLKTGVDVGQSLKSILKSISNEQMIEIKDYSKKLNGYIMIYMILAVVLPSLGMTMLVVVASFLALELSLTFILIAAGILIFVQFIFLTLFRSIRPNVNI